MSRKPSSKRWLQSLLARQNSDRAAHPSARSEGDRLGVEDQSLDEIIADDLHEISTRMTPRSMTLEADRAARIEAYRLEEEQLQARNEARQLEAQRLEHERLEALQIEAQRLERLRQRQAESFSRAYHQEPVTPIDPSSQFDESVQSVLEHSFQADFPEDARSDRSELMPVVTRAELKDQKRKRRDRRRRAIRRARRNMPFKQRVRRALQSALLSLLRGIAWVLTSLLKLLGKVLAAIGKLLLDCCRTIYHKVAPVVKRRRWAFISGTIIALALGTASGAVWWLTKAPPAVQCDKITAWSADAERLDCAQVAADTGKPEEILKGIALVQDWEIGHPMYNRAQRHLTQWTEQLLILAREKLDKQDLDGAIALAKKIPKNSPLYKEVQQEMMDWQEARNLGQKLYDKVQVALKKQAWEDASAALVKLANVNDPTWQKRVTELRKQLDTEKMASGILKQAREFAKANPPEQWGSAIALTDSLNRKTYVWETAKKDIEQWRNKVFDLAIAQLFKQKKAGSALALVKTIPSNIDLSPEQREFVHLAQASEIAGNFETKPLLQQLGHIVMAQQLLAQIPEGSRFRDRAVALLPQLDSHSEDVVNLQLARSIAQLGPLPFVNGAIAQAEQISPQRPRRVQAQTLIAQWKKESQRLEDAPLLAQGEQLSKAGGISGLRQAAGLMDRVMRGRSLYGEAQKRKGQWIAQAETLEDQPILTQARAQANSGNLSQAIQTARRIASGRALHGEATREIYGWGDQLQAIADRAIMDRAAALAAKGNLSQAIDTASSVSSSAVSGEARSSISQWASEREQIRRSQQAPAPAPVDPAPPVRTDDPVPASVEPAPPPQAVEPAPVSPADPEPAPVDLAPAPPPPRTEPEPVSPAVPGR